MTSKEWSKIPAGEYVCSHTQKRVIIEDDICGEDPESVNKILEAKGVMSVCSRERKKEDALCPPGCKVSAAAFLLTFKRMDDTEME